MPWLEYSLFGHEQNAVDLKFSYYRNSSIYEDTHGVKYSLDDYTNQTYWITYYPGINGSKLWQRMWGLSLGFSIDEGPLTRGYGRGQWEVYLALDYNTEELLHAYKYPGFLQTMIRYLNHMKLPAPTIQLYPKLRLHAAYPIRF